MSKSNKQRAALLASVLLLAAGFVAAQDTVSKPPDGVVKLLFRKICDKGCTDVEVTRWKKRLKFERRDLNGDSVPELFVYIDHSDWCGAGANCDYWVFQETKSGFRPLLNDKELRVKDTVTNGYRDLSSETPMGFCGVNVQRLYVTPYRYDGRKYQAQPPREECQAFTPPPES